MKRSRVILASACIMVCVGGGALAVSAASTPDPKQFGREPTNQSDARPKYTAVSDGKGGIAGYVETALLDGAGDMPASPEEAVRTSGTPRLFAVYDTAGVVVGYWGDAIGFVGSDRKPELEREGWRYIPGTPPPAR